LPRPVLATADTADVVADTVGTVATVDTAAMVATVAATVVAVAMAAAAEEEAAMLKLNPRPNKAPLSGVKEVLAASEDTVVPAMSPSGPPTVVMVLLVAQAQSLVLAVKAFTEDTVVPALSTTAAVVAAQSTVMVVKAATVDTVVAALSTMDD